MQRRDFLKLLLGTAIAEVVDVEKLLWVPKPIITVPALPPTMYGIDWGLNDGTVGTWMGIKRSNFPMWKSTYEGKPNYVFMHPTQKKFYDEIMSES